MKAPKEIAVTKSDGPKPSDRSDWCPQHWTKNNIAQMLDDPLLSLSCVKWGFQVFLGFLLEDTRAARARFSCQPLLCRCITSQHCHFDIDVLKHVKMCGSASYTKFTWPVFFCSYNLIGHQPTAFTKPDIRPAQGTRQVNDGQQLFSDVPGPCIRGRGRLPRIKTDPQQLAKPRGSF